jgi:hypothetical protein
MDGQSMPWSLWRYSVMPPSLWFFNFRRLICLIGNGNEMFLPICLKREAPLWLCCIWDWGGLGLIQLYLGSESGRTPYISESYFVSSGWLKMWEKNTVADKSLPKIIKEKELHWYWMLSFSLATKNRKEINVYQVAGLAWNGAPETMKILKLWKLIILGNCVPNMDNFSSIFDEPKFGS